MRYGKGHIRATRQRIFKAAGRRFKQDAIDGAGVAGVMSDAGLTNGAFYAHFASKDELVANVLADQLRVQRQNFDSPAPRSGGTRSVHPVLLVPAAPRPVRRRLPVGRAARRDRPAPRRHQTGVHRRSAQHRDDVAARVDRTDAEAAREDALTILGFMIGARQLARALADRDLSDQILARSREAALKLLDERA